VKKQQQFSVTTVGKDKPSAVARKEGRHPYTDVAEIKLNDYQKKQRMNLAFRSRSNFQ